MNENNLEDKYISYKKVLLFNFESSEKTLFSNILKRDKNTDNIFPNEKGINIK